MSFNSLKPIIWSEKLQETIEFYTQILGFSLDEHNDEWGWASIHKDDVSLMVAKPNAHSAFVQPVFTGSFYINTDNVDEAWEMLQDKAVIVYGIENFEWQMREFAIYDNNGYILQFGQDISAAE